MSHAATSRSAQAAARAKQDQADAALDAKIREVSEHNFDCLHSKPTCDLTPMTVEEARRAPQWKAKERLKLRPKQMRGEVLTEYEQWLLKD